MIDVNSPPKFASAFRQEYRPASCSPKTRFAPKKTLPSRPNHPRNKKPSRGSVRDGLIKSAIDGGLRSAAFAGETLQPQTSSFFAPINVRIRSASNAASNGFLNVSLMLERSKLSELPSSGSKAIRITSENSLLRRKFWQI